MNNQKSQNYQKNKNNQKNQKIYILLVLAAGSLWGMMGLFVRGLSLDGLSSVEMVFFRTVVALIFMFAIILIKDKNLLIIKLKDIWCFIGSGIISLCFFNICYFATIQRTSMAVAAILLYTSPVFVMIFSAILFKEKLTVKKIIALMLAVFGCTLVTGVLSEGESVLNLTGILIGIGAGVGYALYSIFGRYALERGYKSETISFYTFLFCSIGLLAASPFVSLIGVTVNKIMMGNPVRDILLICGIALFVTVLPYLLYTLGLSGIENSKAGIVASIEPVVASVLGLIVYGEVLSVTSVVGIIMVLIAIVILS